MPLFMYFLKEKRGAWIQTELFTSILILMPPSPEYEIASARRQVMIVKFSKVLYFKHVLAHTSVADSIQTDIHNKQ